MKSPTYTTYMSDGYGRDSYILENNGGLSVARVRNNSEHSKFLDCSIEKSSNKMQSSFYKTTAGLAKSPGRINYPPDGTGRDWYIIRENGFNPNKMTFESTLRYD